MDTLNQFYDGKIFVIPPQQRPYSWDTVQVNDLVLDLHTAILRGTKHYTGPIFLEGIIDDVTKFPEEEKNSDNMDLKLKHILDGQQRVTTIMLIAAYLVKSKHLANNANPTLEEKLKNLISYKSEAQKNNTIRIHDKLRMRFSDPEMNKLLSHIVFGKPAKCPTLSTAGMDRLKKNYDYIALNFNKTCQISNDPFTFTNVATAFLERVILKLVDMRSGFNKYTVFESINNRNWIRRSLWKRFFAGNSN